MSGGALFYRIVREIIPSSAWQLAVNPIFYIPLLLMLTESGSLPGSCRFPSGGCNSDIYCVHPVKILPLHHQQSLVFTLFVLGRYCKERKVELQFVSGKHLNIKALVRAINRCLGDNIANVFNEICFEIKKYQAFNKILNSLREKNCLQVIFQNMTFAWQL